MNQDSLLPEDTPGAEAAVAYVNQELGGIKGHPLKLEKCLVTAEEDGQRCGQQFVNNGAIQFVLQGGAVVGNKSFHDTLSGKKPVIIANATVPSDYQATDAYAYTAGTPGITAGMALFVAKRLPKVKKVAVVHSTNDASTAAYNKILLPELKKAGLTDVTGAAVPDTAGTNELTSALQAVHAADADVVVALLTVQSCIAMYDGMQSLGVKAPVVSLGLCNGLPMTQHLKDLGVGGQVPDGWYFAGYGYSFFDPDTQSGMATYLAKLKQYAGPKINFAGLAGPTFATTMTVAKFLNEIGPDNITTDAMRQKAAAFTGPMMMVAGKMSCGANKQYVALCGTKIGIEQYKGNKWLATALGDDGIDAYAN
jgi:branched-chain amino acid transport system substrate-binding protein